MTVSVFCLALIKLDELVQVESNPQIPKFLELLSWISDDNKELITIPADLIAKLTEFRASDLMRSFTLSEERYIYRVYSFIKSYK